MNIETIERDPVEAVVAEVTAPFAEIGERMGATFESVGSALTAAGCTPAGPPVSVWLDVEDESAWRVAVGFPVQPPLPELIGLEHMHLPGGISVVGTHEGPYDGLAAAWDAVTEHVKEGGLQAAAPPWEAYVAAPPAVEDPNKWVTEIIWPVAA